MRRAKYAIDPAPVARAFERFAVGGYRQEAFGEALYRALYCSTFGFIAHFDRAGFYRVRFADLAGRVETLTIMATSPVASQLEEALAKVVVERGLVASAASELRADTERRERAEYERLRAKYGGTDGQQ